MQASQSCRDGARATSASFVLQVRPYFYRYSEDAIDLCDVFGSYSPGARMRLDEICKIVGLAGRCDHACMARDARGAHHQYRRTGESGLMLISDLTALERSKNW